MNITLALTGTRPLLMNSSRLVNPIDPYTRAKKQIAAKRKKTDEDLVEIMRLEARGSAYETAEGLLGLPAENVWASIHRAATAFKLGEDVKRALDIDPEFIAPLLIDGKSTSVDQHLLGNGAIDYRPVKQGRVSVMRARCRVPKGWRAVVEMELDTAVIDLRNLDPVFERAGKYIGVGDWRPRFGRYELEVRS